MFMKTTKEIAEYAEHMYCYGVDILIAIETLDDPDLAPPADIDEKASLNDKFMWEKRMDAFNKFSTRRTSSMHMWSSLANV